MDKQKLAAESTILPQCIRAYKDNIAGFGIGVKYIEDIEETPEAEAEYERMVEIIELLNTDQDTKEVFEDLIEARETYGIAYLEVIRNLDGEVQQIEFLHDTPSVRKTVPLEPYIDTTYYNHGVPIERKKKFRKYRQQLGGKTVYFKEFGDPRVMDRRNGVYVESPEDIKELPVDYEANEILEFPIGIQPYGEVRWTGQILGVDGSQRAERLNNNYFINGRHTPLMIMIQGGTLTEDSYEKLTKYMDDIKGEAGQHAFIVLETESSDGKTDFDQTEKPKIEVKDLASILQKDELFQTYMDNNRKKVQSSFLLPDIYVGYTTDFNRATAQTAQEVTEKQVFQPERRSLAWAINNRLLNGYAFQYVEAFFQEPNISNPDDICKIMAAATAAGGLTPNKAKEMLQAYTGSPSDIKLEPFDDRFNNKLYISTSPKNEFSFLVSDVLDILSKKVPAHIPFSIAFTYQPEAPPAYIAVAQLGTAMSCTIRLPGVIKPRAVGATAYTAGAAASARMMAEVEIPGIITPKSVSAQAYAAGRLAHTHETVTITIGGQTT